MKVKGLVQQHIDSFNYFLDVEMKKIVEANNRITSETDARFFLNYTNIFVESPSVEGQYASRKEIAPQHCRLRVCPLASRCL